MNAFSSYFSHIDFSSLWFWMCAAIQISSSVIWSAIASQIKHYPDIIAKFIIAIIILLVELLGIALFFVDLRKQQTRDGSFYVSILPPTVIFYSAIIYLLVTVIRMFFNNFMSGKFFRLSLSVNFAVLCIQFSFSLAYLSNAGFLLTGLNAFCFVIRLLFAPPSEKKEKVKEE